LLVLTLSATDEDFIGHRQPREKEVCLLTHQAISPYSYLSAHPQGPE
jgi:hypothetical protein